jgi:hypothetical protein
MIFAQVSGNDDGYLALYVLSTLLLACLAMIAIMAIGWYFTRRKVARSISPYTKTPLRRTSELSYTSMVKVYKFMLENENFDNRPIRFWKSAFCRETGRIFSDSITWYGTIKKIDWTFLSKRYFGHYVSWGSLEEDQKRSIRDFHESMEGFQVDFSCPNPLPQDVTPEYIYAKPGPLYVDLHTKVLIGWKSIPDSELEVLVVQKPKMPTYEL